MKYDRNQLEEASKKAESLLDVLDLLDIRNTSSSKRHIKQRLEREGIDTSHFQARRRAKPRKLAQEVFSVSTRNTRTPRETLLPAMLEQGIAYQCKICGISEWLGAALLLHIDHENGDWQDNRIENLRFLCPNCHVQQPTTYSKRGPITVAPHQELVKVKAKSKYVFDKAKASNWLECPVVPTCSVGLIAVALSDVERIEVMQYLEDTKLTATSFGIILSKLSGKSLQERQVQRHCARTCACQY